MFWLSVPMSASRASGASMLIREKGRELRVSALSGVKRASSADHAPENALQMRRTAAIRTEVGTLSKLLCPSGSATGNRVWASWSPYGRPARHISTLAALSMTVRTAPFGRKIAAGAARSARHGVDVHPVSRPILRPRFPVVLPGMADGMDIRGQWQPTLASQKGPRPLKNAVTRVPSTPSVGGNR
jgi:hypothetical protein